MSEIRLRRRLGRILQSASDEPSVQFEFPNRESGSSFSSGDEFDDDHVVAEANTSALDDDSRHRRSNTAELREFEIWQAYSARATSAAPSYLTEHENVFEPIKPASVRGVSTSNVRRGTQDDDQSSTIDELSSDGRIIDSASTRCTLQSASHPRANPEDLQLAPDLQNLARNVVNAVDFLVRVNERYQRYKEFTRANEEGLELEGRDDDWNLNNLESGQPRRSITRTLRWGQQSPKPSAIEPESTTSPSVNSIFRSTSATSPAQVPRSLDDETSPTIAKIFRSRPPPSKRPCYYLITTLAAGLISSLVLALWWARSAGDISAGFTVGSYVVAVVALIIAAAGVFHAPRCRCWRGAT
ncbi:hypothetical protein F5Y18DRAFT_422327 [Xylariaceae sp. FL1019]|nr:hypothetical protein F5Y18DRAFT_422327 [Xylariaceae sp. FL1019]